MRRDYLTLPIAEIFIDANTVDGPLESWRHTLGHGGINPLPLPPRVVDGLKKLQPRLIRIFIQEFFNIYPEHGRFNWSLLDPYMDALVQTGAKVVAAIAIKPPVLYPQVGDAVWRPNNVAEWQQVIAALVRRYSVKKTIVTYWEVGNEPDIGENGGCPYLIPNPDDYYEFYTMAIRPVLETFPQAKVGGPAACWITNQPLPGLVQRCREHGTRLDFISWHGYHNDPNWHAYGVELAKDLLKDWPGPCPEMLYTEWNKFFEIDQGVMDPHKPQLGRVISVEDMAFEPRRAAAVAAAIIRLIEAGLDWSFYYHIWDQVFFPETFRTFFSERGLNMMNEHWNEVPHRFGLFGVNGEVRPQYFVYRMLHQMEGEEIPLGEKIHLDEKRTPGLTILATRAYGTNAAGSTVFILCANYQTGQGGDRVLQVNYQGLLPGLKRLTVHRIDGERRWNPETLDLLPVESRTVYTPERFACQVFLPEDSVAFIRLESEKEIR